MPPRTLRLETDTPIRVRINVANGNAKKQEIINQKETENQSLTAELQALQQQLININMQIQTKQNLLSDVNNKYQPKISEIDFKLQANDVAKDKIVSSINKVKNGINNNLK